MTTIKSTRGLCGAGLALCALHMAGCASTPKVAPAPAPPPPPAAAPPVVTMAPIPNPQEAPAQERRATPRPRSAPATAATKRDRAKAAPAPTTTTAPAPASPAADPARAAKLRARGLEELDRGAVTRAVALLSQASQLDPSSAVIRRDLERAQRIARAVHGSR